MANEGWVTTERQGHVWLMGLDRVAKRNAFDLAMFGALGMAYAELERDDNLRCGVLFAHGDHFTGGVDLAEWAPVSRGGSRLPDGAIDPLGLAGQRLSKPVIARRAGQLPHHRHRADARERHPRRRGDARFAQIE